MLPFAAISGLPQDTVIINQALNADETPATSTLVVLYREGVLVGSCVTDAAGVYKFSDLIAGNYKVKINFRTGADYLWVDYTSSQGLAINPLKLNYTTAATFTITTSSSSTTVGLSSTGSKYSFYCPPTVITNDGYAGKGLVSFATGALSGVTTLASGTGTSTTAAAVTLPQSTPSYLPLTSTSLSTSTIGGAPNLTTDNGDALAAAMNAMLNTASSNANPWYTWVAIRVGYAYPPWSDPPSVTQFAGAWIKKFNLLHSTFISNGGNTLWSTCLAWYPMGSIMAYGNDPSAVYGALSADGISYSLSIGGSNSYISITLWKCELIDRSGACHTIPSNPPGMLEWNEYPGPNQGCGYVGSYAGLVQIKAAAQAQQTAFDKARNGKNIVLNDLPNWLKNGLITLGFGAGTASFIRYLNNYCTYSALENLADARATIAIKAAQETYGVNSNEAKLAKAQAMNELNAAKGYFANEFIVKPALEKLASLDLPSIGIPAGVIDYLRGVPSGTTRSDVINTLAPIVTTIINTGYQFAESPTFTIIAGIAILEANPVYGASMIIGGMIEFASGTGSSIEKSVGDLIQQTSGVYTQPSWLSNTYDTLDLFKILQPTNINGKRITFAGGTYSTSTIPMPSDALSPYVYNTATQTFVTNPNYIPE